MLRPPPTGTCVMVLNSLLLTCSLRQITSCMDDDNQSTRLVSCKVLQLVLMAKPDYLNGQLDTKLWHMLASACRNMQSFRFSIIISKYHCCSLRLVDSTDNAIVFVRVVLIVGNCSKYPQSLFGTLEEHTCSC